MLEDEGPDDTASNLREISNKRNDMSESEILLFSNYSEDRRTELPYREGEDQIAADLGIDDEFLRDSMSYKWLSSKIDQLLQRLDLDA